MAARGERFLLQRVKEEEDDAAACLPPSLLRDKENHFINCGPMWHDLTINLTSVLKVSLVLSPWCFCIRFMQQ